MQAKPLESSPITVTAIEEHSALNKWEAAECCHKRQGWGLQKRDELLALMDNAQGWPGQCCSLACWVFAGYMATHTDVSLFAPCQGERHIRDLLFSRQKDMKWKLNELKPKEKGEANRLGRRCWQFSKADLQGVSRAGFTWGERGVVSLGSGAGDITY